LRRKNDLLAKYGGGWAIVTGASDGIGEAMAYELASKGFSVVLMARSEDKLANVAKTCEERYGVQTKVIVFDFATLNSIEGVQTLEEILKDMKQLEISLLVNNVGKANADYIHNHSAESVFQMIHVNICSQTFMSVFTVPLLLSHYEKTEKRAAIINFSSSSAYDHDPLISVYAATKAYNQVFSICTAKEYKDKIDVLTVMPRSVKTQMNSGKYMFTILPDAHAHAVVEGLGRENITWGHYYHGF
jgi:17beta-estradiol 17-dehydrogenase / very-long-chain 3-oxoacyl-CoA reductase